MSSPRPRRGAGIAASGGGGAPWILEVALRPVTEMSGGQATGARLRWGILSTAGIATEKVIPGIGRSTRGEVVAIASRDADRGQAVAQRLGIPRVHGSYEALLADPDVDAVYIPLPNHLHAEWTIAAARAGKHVLCEKPLAMTAADAERMIEACRGRGRPAHGGVHVPPPSVLGRRARARGVGPDRAADRGPELVLVLQRRPGEHPEHPGVGRRRAVRHRLLLASTCRGCCSAPSRRGSRPRSLRDPASGVDMLTSGHPRRSTAAIATFTCSTRAEPDQRVHVYGTEGRISIEIPFNIPPDRPTHVFVTAGGDPPVAPATETLTFAPADPYAVEADRFAAAVLDGAPLPTPPEDAVANLRVIERLFAAASTT